MFDWGLNAPVNPTPIPHNEQQKAKTRYDYLKEDIADISNLRSNCQYSMLGYGLRRFCEENYQWGNSKTDELLMSCVNDSILRKVVSNGRDSYRVVTYSTKNTQLDDTEVLPGDQHIVPVDASSSIPPLSPIDILEEFTNFKTFVCQELNFIKQELPDVKQNTNKSDR